MNIRFLIRTKLISLASLGLVLTQPTTASTVVAEDAVVYNPPSNVRVEPNGRIICQIRRKTTISVYHFTTSADPNAGGSPSNGWYSTNACGTNRMGWIHQSQIKLTGKTHSAP